MTSEAFPELSSLPDMATETVPKMLGPALPVPPWLTVKLALSKLPELPTPL